MWVLPALWGGGGIRRAEHQGSESEADTPISVTASPCVKPVTDRQAAQLPVNRRLLHEEGVLGQQTRPRASAHQDRPQGLHCRGRILRERGPHTHFQKRGLSVSTPAWPADSRGGLCKLSFCSKRTRLIPRAGQSWPADPAGPVSTWTGADHSFATTKHQGTGIWAETSGFPPLGLGSRGLLSQGTTGADGGGEVRGAQPLAVSSETGGCELVLRNHDVQLAQSSLQAAARPHIPCVHAAQCLAPGDVPPGRQGPDGPTDVRSEHNAEAEPQSPGPRPRLFIPNQLSGGCHRLRSESRLRCKLLGTRIYPALSWVSPRSGPRASTYSRHSKNDQNPE